jgi:hypothetical protein
LSLAVTCKSVSSLEEPPAHELRSLVVTRCVLDPKVYIRCESAVVVVGIVHRYVLAPILAWEGLVGDFFRKHHSDLRVALGFPVHRKAVAGFGFVESGTHRKYPALIPQIEFYADCVPEIVGLHLSIYLRRTSTIAAAYLTAEQPALKLLAPISRPQAVEELWSFFVLWCSQKDTLGVS